MIQVSIQPLLDVIRQIHLTTGRILDQRDSDVEKAIRLVCLHFGMSRAELFTKSTRSCFVLPRWCLFWLLHRNRSKRNIAEVCHLNRHTVMYGLKKLQDRMETEPSLRKELAWLEEAAQVKALKEP